MSAKVQTQELHITKNKVIQGRQIRIFVTKIKTLVFQRTSHDISLNILRQENNFEELNHKPKFNVNLLTNWA